MSLYLAVDAGGTKTECWIAGRERVLGRASAGTIKLMNVGEEVAERRLHQLLLQTAAAAGVTLDTVERTCMGLAGISSEGARQWAEATLRGVVSGEVLLRGDEEIALEAAFQGGPGVLVIAGTGSHVVGRCSDGTRASAGGWGPMLGDEGSGTWIGLEAIRAGLRAADRSVETCLLREIQKFWKSENLSALVAKANHRSRVDFAELSSVVAHCAEEGDALAQGVLDRAGEELAAQVSLVISKMQAAGCDAADTRQVAFTGSVLGKIPRVLHSLEAHLRSALPNVEVAKHAVEPLEGALWCARGGF